MSGILQVLYTCHRCRLKDRPVTVAHRKEGEDLGIWVKKVAQWVANDHLAHSPNCTARTCDLKIPLGSYGEGIGFAAKETPAS